MPASPAALYYEHTFAAQAALDTEITLLGETETSQTPDQTIQVSVSVAELNSILTYSDQWTPGTGPGAASGEQPLPAPKVNFHDVALSLRSLALQDAFTAPGAAGVAMPTMTDDSGDNTLKTLQNYFVNDTFSWSAYSDGAEHVAATDLNAIPVENVTKVLIKNVSCDPLVDILPGASGSGSAVEDVDMNTGMDYARDLFEQAVAAGKVPGGGSTAFTEGDSITVYVSYTLTKSKTFLLDSVQGSGVAKFKIAGTDIEVPNATTLSGTEVRTIAWQFKA